jgi:hypothetical protein
MTLIATGGFHTFPAIFGDLLISGTSPGPAAVSAIAASSQSPVAGLEQKLVLLGNDCVIGWAGSAPIARSLIGELRAKAAQAPLSMAIVDAHFAQIEPAAREQVSFVGWVKEAELFHQFWYRADVAQSAMFGRISAGGSGATDFVKLASQVSANTWHVMGGVPDGLDRAVSWMLSGTSLLLQAEVTSQGNHPRGLGSGYEIATYVGDRFEKVGDLAFVFWMADVVDGHVSLSGPELVLKQDYAGESLLLHVLRMQPGELEADPAVIEEARHVIPPFAAAPDAGEPVDISWPGMQATFTCHLVFVRSTAGLSVANRVEYSPTRTPGSIRFTSDDGQSNMEVSQAFCDELVETIRSVDV